MEKFVLTDVATGQQPYPIEADDSYEARVKAERMTGDSKWLDPSQTSARRAAGVGFHDNE